MIFFLKHIKGIAYLLAMLILFQSCIAYRSKTSSINEATEIDKRHIKITTKKGEKYKLRWIEEKDGNIVSIKNTKRKYIDKKNIDKVLIYNPTPIVVPIEKAQNHRGTVLLRTNKFNDIHPYVIDSYNHSFLKIGDAGDFVKGYKMTGKDTLTVTIPISEIKNIKVASIAGNITIYVVGAFMISMAVWAVVALSQIGDDF